MTRDERNARRRELRRQKRARFAFLLQNRRVYLINGQYEIKQFWSGEYEGTPASGGLVLSALRDQDGARRRHCTARLLGKATAV